jgi:hypothetical protein
MGLQNILVLSAIVESQSILSSRLTSTAGLASVLLVAFVAPVLAANYNPGVSVGEYVILGNWYSINVPPTQLVNWEKIEVIAVSGKEVTWRMTGQMKNGSAILNNGETYVVDVETGATNYTHSLLGPIIAADLNQGDKVQAGPATFEVNKTEIDTYLNVSRPVNVLVYEASVVSGGLVNSTSTFVYDKASGMLLEDENRIYRSNATNPDHLVYMSVTDTNIFSPFSPLKIPVEIVYAIAAAVVVAPIGTAVVVLRRRRQTEEKTKVLKTKATDLAYNLGGVNRGECYLADSLEHCLKVASDLHSRGVNVLCIVREDPESIIENYNLKPDDVVLLSSKPIKGFKAVDGLQEVAITIMKFLKAGGGAVILDGFEYLISRFGFNTVYKMCQENHIGFLEAGAVLLIPLNMETLDNREKGQLLSELKVL